MTTRGPTLRPRPSNKKPMTQKAKPVPRGIAVPKKNTNKNKNKKPERRQLGPMPRPLTRKPIQDVSRPSLTKKVKPLHRARIVATGSPPKNLPHSPTDPPPVFIKPKWTFNNLEKLKPKLTNLIKPKRARKQSKGAKKIELMARLKLQKELRNLKEQKEKEKEKSETSSSNVSNDSNESSDSSYKMGLIAKRRQKNKNRITLQSELRRMQSTQLNGYNENVFQGMKNELAKEPANNNRIPLPEPVKEVKKPWSLKNDEKELHNILRKRWEAQRAEYKRRTP